MMRFEWILGAALAGMLLAAPQKDPKAEALLGAAIHQEEAEGNLEAAIAAYKKVLAQYGSNRPLAARAQYRLGLCYEKLGDTEARKAYERVVSQYGDQVEVVKQARARLAALAEGPGGGGIRTRQVWKGTDVNLEGSVSGDGRYLSFTDWSTGDVALRDLTTGENRRLTSKESRDWAQTSTISHDGSMVAYAFWNDKANTYELRLVSTKGGQPRVLFANREWTRAMAWTPDDQHVIGYREVGKKVQLDLVSVKDGSARTLATVDNYAETARVSPDGRWLAYDPHSSPVVRHFDIHVQALDGSRGGPVIEHPADDRLLAWTPDGSALLFTSNRSGAPATWVQPVRDGKPAGSPQLFAVNLGSVKPLGVSRSGALYYGVRTFTRDVYLADWDAAAGRLAGPPVKATEQNVGRNMTPVWTRDGRLVFYSNPRSSLAPQVMVRSADGSVREFRLSRFAPTVFPVALFPDGRSCILPRGDPTGHYLLDFETGKEELLFRAEASRRIFVSPDGGSVYYARQNVLIRRDLATGRETEVTRQVFDSAFRGVSLSPDGRQMAFLAPGSTGKLALSLLSLETGQVREVSKDVGGAPHIWSITWEADGRHLLFVRRGGKPELMRISVDGGEPQPVGFQMEGLAQPAISPDGRKIAFEAGTGSTEVWVLEHLPGVRR